MALFTRLKTICAVEKCLRINLVSKSSFHFVSGGPHLRLRDVAPMVSRRTYFLKIFRKPSQRDLKIKDDIPDAFVMIYRNTMSKYIFGAQVISVIASSLVLLAIVTKSDYEDYKRDFEKWSPTSRTTPNEHLYYILFFVTFLVLLQVMVSRTPIRIYKVPQTPKYITVSYGNYFFTKEKYAFKRGEIHHMEERGFLPWRENMYAIEKETDRRTVILLDHYFRRPADLSIMLGEQRDPDLDD
ncbi:hypothetical protein BDFB_008305 [Asbolus verrucosus]|uniref:Uncharacterized protein n=1 Tax=Asbolus verrucosus TaxID=1661398 RepID=A0A482VS30_ASBVE|nr:hypothetical protein BDFB_008305 [Asbolus verrucosus]